LLALLLKTPILDDFSEERTNDGLVKNEIDFERLEQYIKENTYEKGILLRRMYYGIVADKP